MESSPEAPAQQRQNSVTLPPNTGSRSNTMRNRKPTEDGQANGDASISSPSRLELLRRATSKLMEPTKRVGPAPSVLSSLRSILLASWLNVLLICIPVSWALHFALPDQHTLVFVFSFLAIIPLAKLLAFATDELSMRVGQTLAGLLNATLGNAVELIVAILALVKCELTIVQSSLVGSILSNLLLVLGMCFFAGGTQFSEQGFGVSAVQLNSSLLTISVIAVLLPAAFVLALSNSDSQTPSGDGRALGEQGKEILQLSRGVAIILLFIYGSYLFFQLKSHTALYSDKGEHVIKSTPYEHKLSKEEKRKASQEKDDATLVAQSGNSTQASTMRTGTMSSAHALNGVATGNGHAMTDSTYTDVERGSPTKDEDDEDEEIPQLSVAMTIGLLGVVTVLVAVTAEWLVDSIDGIASGGKISKEFIGVILLPIVGNAAEHVTAVTVSVKDKLNLSLGVAVGSSIQIALFVIPFIITLAWILDKPLTLLFDPYESITMFLAVLVVNYVVQDGKSNWLEGMVLMCLYVILGVTFWFYPGSNATNGVIPQCT
ncbi:hypothetical protein HGRIS_003788 [Hohenbuehelia grisea]|uniref:Sodium/calcium exchanger membrane region domain-containing protein n=1 Tax=Hohenbuehelia grisea TaxID=104357 RepID=A0ABR3JGU0_9AGAR